MFHSALAMRGLLVAVVLVGTLIALVSGLEFEILSVTKPLNDRSRHLEAEELSLLSILLSAILSVLAISCGRFALAERQTRLKAEQDALLDPLTGLPNRRVFEKSLAQALSAPSALLLIDLNRFKQVNDILGHAAGDALLAATGERIRKAVPKLEDCARIGGDEFAVILRDGNATELNARAIVSWLGLQLSKDVVHRGRCFGASASIGLAFSYGKESAVEWMEAADVDMYQRKAQRRLLDAA